MPPVSYELLGRNGRLGNQLWQIASTLGIARARGEEPRFPAWEYQPYFCCPPEWFTFDPAYLHIDASQLAVTLEPRTRSYLQDLSLFGHVADEVRMAFEPSLDARVALDVCAPALPTEQETIALHVRRTDLLQKSWANPPLPLEYYRRALVDLPDDALLVIFGDDPTFQDQLGQQLHRDYTVIVGATRIAADWIGPEAYAALPPPLDWIDLFLMRDCTYHVIANSTFSWWAAWLADDIRTRYPFPWFGSVLEEYCDHRLLIPPGWREVVWT